MTDIVTQFAQENETRANEREVRRSMQRERRRCSSFVFKATPLAILIRDLVNHAGQTLCEGAEL